LKRLARTPPDRMIWMATSYGPWRKWPASHVCALTQWVGLDRRASRLCNLVSWGVPGGHALPCDIADGC
ncbi:MAG: hypothetical protein AAGB46_13220, partial [Verrucomicrobiota bacterium]